MEKINSIYEDSAYETGCCSNTPDLHSGGAFV